MITGNGSISHFPSLALPGHQMVEACIIQNTLGWTLTIKFPQIHSRLPARRVTPFCL
jgi:hypothetical protein